MGGVSDTKFTPGPWRVIDRTTNGVKGYEICWSDDGECVTDHVYEEADAHLMAAAKDLYAAAVESLAVIEKIIPDGHGRGTIVRLQAALSKARGNP